MALHTLERLTLGGNAIKGLANVRFDPNYAAVLRGGGSELDATHRVITAGTPLLTFDTLDVDAALRMLFNTSGTVRPIPFLAVTSGAPAVFYLQSLDDGIVRATAGTNYALKITKGVIVPTRVSGAGEVAVLTCALYVDADGTNTPVQKITGSSANLPGGAPGAAALSRLMGVKCGSTLIGRVADWSADFGVRVVRPPSPDLYPRSACVAGCAPTLTFRTADIVGALGVASFGTAQAGAGGVQAILALYDDSGVGYSTSNAIALVARMGSLIVPNAIDAGGVAAASYTVYGRGNTSVTDYADAPLTLTTGVTVPAEPDSAAVFMAGPVFDGSTRIEPRSSRVDFGIAAHPMQAESDLWPTKIVALQRAPSFDVAPHDSGYYTGLGEGRLAAGNGLKFCLRGLTDDGVPYADADTRHVTILAPLAWLAPEQASAAHGAVAAHTVRATPVKGAAALLTIGTGQTIAAP